LLNSTVGTTTNPFQISIDSLNSKRLINEANISINTSEINLLKSDNITNKSDLVILKADNNVNKLDIVNLKADNVTNKSDILSLQNFTVDEASKLSSQINKEYNDVLSINTNVNTLSATVASNYNILNTKINTIDDRETNDNQAIKDDISTKYNNQQSKNLTFEGQISTLSTNQSTNNTTLSNSLNTLDAKHDSDKVLLQNQITTNLNSSNAHFYINDADININKNDIVNIKADNLIEKAKVQQLQLDVPANLSEINLLKSDNTNNKAKLLLHTNNLLSIETNISNNASDIVVLKSDVENLKQYDIQNNIDKNLNNVNVNQNITDIFILKNQTIPNLDDRFVKKNGDSLTGTLFVNDLDYNGVLNIGKSSTNINIGSELNEDIKVINIGGANDLVNIKGTLNNIQTTNMQVENKIITLNKGAVGNIQSGSVGLQIRDNNSDSKGYFVTNSSANEFHFKMPQEDQIMKLKKNPTELYDIATKLYVDAKDEARQVEITQVQAAQLQLANDVSTVNNNILSEIPFSKINAFPSDNTKILFGDGVFRTLSNFSGVSQLYVDNADLLKADKTYVDNSLSTQTSTNDSLYMKKSGGVMSGKLTIAEIDNNLNPLLIGTNATTITIGSLSNVDNKVINIGGANDIVNILGSTNYIQTTNTKVQNKVMVLNDGSVGNNQSAGVGIHFKDNDLENKGYMIVGANGVSLDLKPPQSERIFKIKDTPTENYDLTTKLYVDSLIKSTWKNTATYTISSSASHAVLLNFGPGNKYQFNIRYNNFWYPVFGSTVAGTFQYSGTLNYASNGQGYFGQSFNNSSAISQSIITLGSGPMETAGRHISGTIYDGTNLYRFIVLLTVLNGQTYTWVSNAEQLF
jgi:hypothetical protein